MYGLMEISRGLQSWVWAPDLGGRLVSWKVRAVELLARHGDDPVEFGMYPMAPWAGRVRGNEITVESARRMGIDVSDPISLRVNYLPWALHGTCFTSPIDSMTQIDDTVVSRQIVPNWPWSVELVNTWHLRDDGFDVTMTLRSDEVTPAILGWHPWFHRTIHGASASWSSKDATVSTRVDAFPTDEWSSLADRPGPYDDAFHCPTRRVDIEWPGVISLSVESSHPWFVMFDELPDALCVEPQTQIPNAWNDPIAGEPETAQPGSDLTLFTRWRWSRPAE